MSAYDSLLTLKVAVEGCSANTSFRAYQAFLRLKAALEENGVDFQYFELPHSGHSLQNDTAISKQWMDAVVEYLDKYMPVR